MSENQSKSDFEGSAVKFDHGKVDFTLLPWDALEEVARVMEYGAKKYARGNYRAGFSYTRTLGALLRHVYAFLRGEDKDPETGLSHMAHACCNCLFMLVMLQKGTGVDDREEY